MEWINIDSSAIILNTLDHHWLILGFLWGAFKIIAKRTETKVDDDMVELIDKLKERKDTK